MHEHTCDVAVIGGGLAGSAAALAFARRGCTVRLFERRDLARDPNRGDILHAPTVEVLRRLGILDFLEARGAARWHGLEFVDSAGALSVGSEIRESWLLNHAEMEAVFLEAAESAGTVMQPDRVRALMIEMNTQTRPQPKLAYLWRDLHRRAEMYGFAFEGDAPYPLTEFDLANRVALVGAAIYGALAVGGPVGRFKAGAGRDGATFELEDHDDPPPIVTTTTEVK